MARAFLSVDETTLATLSDNEILGLLADRSRFDLKPAQRAAWTYQIEHLRIVLAHLPDARAFMEFLIPRMGRRADLVLLRQGILFIIEYKVGAKNYDRASFNQVYGYGLDLKYFHETSHGLLIIPILVATQAPCNAVQGVDFDDDGLAQPIGVNADGLVSVISDICRDYRASPLDACMWEAGRYQPTPTIIEAAQALYNGHNVAEISRSEAGSTNITVTANYVEGVIDAAKRERRKMICFITGVPGSGKTLAGLNLAIARQRAHADEHALFLSGNGPLVDVLREALVADAIQAADKLGDKTDKPQETRRVGAFIQNIHHFRDEALKSPGAPVEKVVVFDEA